MASATLLHVDLLHVYVCLCVCVCVICTHYRSSMMPSRSPSPAMHWPQLRIGLVWWCAVVIGVVVLLWCVVWFVCGAVGVCVCVCVCVVRISVRTFVGAL